MYEGSVQYQVQWEGYDDITWTNADALSCYELIEDFELNL